MDYYLYLQSPEWRKKRRAALRRAKYRCQYCGVRGVKLECHHLTYDRLGNEKPNDLRIACQDCHPVADRVRRFEAGMKTYMTKKYGNDWQDKIGAFEATEEFKRWLESKNV